LKLGKQNITPSKPRVDELSNPWGLKLTMVIFCNSNDEIIRNIDWEF
jgi:hypothetical protein